MVFAITHDYTPDSIAAAVAAWRRVLDAPGVTVAQQTPWGRSGTDGCGRAIVVTDAWLTALVISYGEPTDRYPALTATLISYSDYHGSDLDAANVATLSGWPGVTVHTDGHHGDSSAEMIIGELPADDYPPADRCDPTSDSDVAELIAELVAEGIARVEAVADALDQLTDYPLLSDEDHTAYVAGLADAAWEQWICADLRFEIGGLLNQLHRPDAPDGPDGWERWDDADESAIRDAYYRASLDWGCDGATSVVNHNHTDAVAAVLRDIFGVDPTHATT